MRKRASSNLTPKSRATERRVGVCVSVASLLAEVGNGGAVGFVFAAGAGASAEWAELCFLDDEKTVVADDLVGAFLGRFFPIF